MPVIVSKAARLGNESLVVCIRAGNMSGNEHQSHVTGQPPLDSRATHMASVILFSII
jgi:hypothetical protein